ncbi:unnamed protein product, partial [Ectocarpus sp. 8 AP-2014]
MATPSFVQTSQLAPFLLSQIGGAHGGSFAGGAGAPSFLGRTTSNGAPAAGPVGQEQNFYWLERFYAAHRSGGDGLSFASGDPGPRTAAATTASLAGLTSHGGGGGGGSRFAPVAAR